MGVVSAEEKQLSIFLSYSEEDKPFADWLYKKLINANLRVWYDEYDLLVGDSLTANIAEGLKNSDFLIVVISQRAVRSKWVKAELEPKILRQIEERPVTVLPVVLDDINPGKISNFFKGMKWLPFPRQGSDEAFDVLLKSIEGHLQRRSSIPAIQSAPQNLFGLRGSVEPDRFIVPELLVRMVTEDIVNKQSISIIGARMMGKSSLLKFLTSPLCQDYYRDENDSSAKMQFVYLDFQQHASKNRDELLSELAHAMSESLVTRKHFQGSTYIEALDWIRSTAGRRKTLRSLWVLLFDEFDRVSEMNGANTAFFDVLRNLSQNYNLCFVIASQRKLADLPLLQSSNTSPFFNIFKEHFLTVWDEHTTRKLMFKPYGKELELFNDNDFAFISQLTARHPLLLQIGCYHLFNAYRIDREMMGDYDRLLDAYMEEAEDVYRHYWNYEINYPERAWLSDCWQALSQKGQIAQEELQRLSLGYQNRIIRTKLARIGFLLTESRPLKIPIGLQAFLERMHKV